MPPRRPRTDRAPRQLWRAGLLSLLMPGLGHIYCGLTRRGVAIWSAVLVALLAAVFAWARWLFVPAGPVTVAAGAYVALQVVLWSDLARFIERYGADYTLRPMNHELSYLALFLGLGVLPVLLTGVAVERALVGSVAVSDRTMFPQLLPGDRLLFDRGAFADAPPGPGDLVVVERATDPLRIARVVAAAGETVHLRDARPVIDGAEPTHAPIEEMRVDRFGPEQQTRLDALEGFVEQRAEGSGYIVTYDRAARRSVVSDPAPVGLAPDELFVIGDNRDEAVAGRVFGRVSLAEVAGRPRYVWLSVGADGLRPGRMGLEVR